MEQLKRDLFDMDVTNPIIQLCVQGALAEFEHRTDDARALYQQAWDLHSDDYEACIAAHYLARFQNTPEETLRWNQSALAHADAAGDERVREFYPSLYLNLGRSNEVLGNQNEAQRYYDLAAELDAIHQPD
jgi:tetratricopeptide (TPR) repeat protein